MAVLYSYFIFDNKFHVQHEGIGMGLLLRPTFANIFMCHHERNWLLTCPNEFKPLVYRSTWMIALLFNNKQEEKKTERDDENKLNTF